MAAETACAEIQGIYENALAVHRARLETIEDTPAPQHPARVWPAGVPEADKLLDDAVKKRDLSEYATALELLGQARAIYDVKLGVGSARAAYTLYQIGVVQSRLRNRSAALEALAELAGDLPRPPRAR